MRDFCTNRTQKKFKILSLLIKPENAYQYRMSSAEVAVHVFRSLENEDLRILQVIETAMSKHEFVPKEQIANFAQLPIDRIDYEISKLNKLGLIYQTKGAYVGHTLNYAGYDCLAINAFVKAGIIEAFGHSLGVGKEADVFDALTPKNVRVAVKFHRLGRISFRQTQRKRGYVKEHAGWLFQSRLAAEKEFQALKRVYACGVAVPEPLSQNRHCIVLVRDDKHILIIDWPQFVTVNHPNSEELLRRDLRNLLRFFSRRFRVEVKIEEAFDYVSGKSRSL